MTAPIWFAVPPETHSALLSTGPGAGPLSIAAESWRGLAAAYSETSDELEVCLAAARTQWQGRSSEHYVAAHQPFVEWLHTTAAAASTVAARHETVAGAYRSALATMPTMAELAANHTLHRVLVATNFFGLNTIPIALNESDYWRMWVQVATVMASYQTIAESSHAAVPTAAAPKILNTATARQVADASGQPDCIRQLEQLLTDLRNCVSPLGPLGNLLTPVIPVVINIATGVFNFAVSVVTGYPITVYGPLLASLASGIAQLGLLGIGSSPVAEAAAGRVPAQGATYGLAPLVTAVSASTSAGALPVAPSVPSIATPPSPANVANVVTVPGTPYLAGGPDAEGFTPTPRRPVAPVRELRNEGGAASAATGVASDSSAARAQRRRRKHRHERLEGGGRMTLSTNIAETSPAITGSDQDAEPLGVTAASTGTARGLTRLADGVFGERRPGPDAASLVEPGGRGRPGGYLKSLGSSACCDAFGDRFDTRATVIEFVDSAVMAPRRSATDPGLLRDDLAQQRERVGGPAPEQ